MAFLEEHARDHAEEPFFLFMSFPKPHAPYDPPRPYDALYDPREVPAPFQAAATEHKPRTPTKQVEARTHGWELWSPECHRVARAHYYGQVTFQDEQIGRMLTYLEERGLLEDTIVVYAADHGDLLGDFGFFAKSCFYRGSVQIPLIIHWPAQLQRGLQADPLVGLHDLFPTLSSLAGLELPNDVDGRDLSPLLRGQAVEERDFFVSYCMGPPNQLYMIADHRWKYCYSQAGGTEELYDLVDDPQELVDLADRADSWTTLRTMRERLVTWARENGDEGILDGDGLAVSPHPVIDEVDFRPGTMGWRWY